MDAVVAFLTGTSAFSAENQSFWMAVQGAMAVRKGPNKDSTLPWFHAFTLSVVLGFAGGLLGFIWMGKPSAFLSNDLNMAACMVAFALVNYTPMNVGFRILDTLPFSIVTVSFAQLFRATGLIKFVKVCFEEFKGSPSKYYPIPVFGPIIYGTMLGNMGGFLAKGLEGHVGGGMPWPMQNGAFCATFYHFFVHDQTGPIGIWLRGIVPIRLGLDDATFAAVVVSFFMQIVGILQMPRFLGPNFSPFAMLHQSLTQWMTPSPKVEKENESRKLAKQQIHKNKQKAS